MNRLLITFVAVLIAAGAQITPAQQNAATVEQLFARAQHKATVDGDLKGALEDYKRVVDRAGSNRALAAEALLRMAEAYEKLGDAEAGRVYEQLVRDYADRKESAAARARLAKPVAAAGMIARELWPGDGTGIQASLSPDGRSVVTHAIRDIRTGSLTKILPDYDPARGGFEEWPVLSPDGTHVAFARCCYDGAYEVQVSRAELGAPRRTLLRNPEFSYYFLGGWSPDGRSILAIVMNAGRNAQLAWISAADGGVKTLKSLEWRSPGLARLSPDGRFVAYDVLVRQGGTEREIRIMASDASRETVVAGEPGDHSSPVWTRDGSRLVFVSKRSGTAGLWSVPVRDGRAAGPPELVRPNMAGIRPLGFSSTGSLVYVQLFGNQNVFTQRLDPETGQAAGEPQKAVDTFVGANTTPSWSPDGKFVAYISRRVEPTDQNSPATLVIRAVETGQETVVPTTFTYPGQPRWFPDGRSILQVARNDQNTTCLYKVDVKTGDVQQLVNTGAGLPPGAALSADGATAYVRHPQKLDTLAAYDLATGRATELRGPAVQGPFLTIAPSPDGRRLAYPARNGAGNLRLHVMNADGSDARDLFAAYPQKGFVTGMTWTPDGRHIYFVLSDGASVLGHASQLWRVPADGGAPFYTGLSISTMGAISLNHDGTRLAVGAGELIRSEYWALDNLERAWKPAPR